MWCCIWIYIKKNWFLFRSVLGNKSRKAVDPKKNEKKSDEGFEVDSSESNLVSKPIVPILTFLINLAEIK